MILPPNLIQKKSTLLTHSKQDSASVAPLHKHNYVHQDDPTKTTIRNEQFQSVLVGSLLTASAPFVTWNEKKVLMQTDMLDITVTSKVIENNLNPHKAAGPDQIKHIILQNLSTPLSPILKYFFQKSLDSEFNPSKCQVIHITRSKTQSLHWRRLDQRRIDNKLSIMYNITHNLIAIPISDFLIPLVRPYRLITATTDY